MAAGEAVTPRQPSRKRHIPQRTCVGCRTVQEKRTLLRVVRTPQGVQVDPTGKLAGRGAYLHDRRTCWTQALKGSLAHALKTELSDDDRERLNQTLETLPAEDGREDA